MSSVFDHLHIKRNTAGSSNELSFDVLDAARGDLDSRRGRTKPGPVVLRPVKQDDYNPTPSRSRKKSVKEKKPKEPKPVEGSFHGVRGTSSLSGEEEVVQRKRQRRAHSVQLWAVAFVAVIVVIGITAYVSYDYYRDLKTFQTQFVQVIDVFVQADEELPLIEEFVEAPFNSTAEKRREVREYAADAQKELIVLKEQIAAASSYAIVEDDNVVVSQALTGAESRQTMLAAVIKMTEIVDSSASGAAEVAAIWNEVLDADQLARTASAAANKASTDEAIEASKEQTSESRKKLQEVSDTLSKIDTSKITIDLAPHKEYLNVRIQALDCALATSDALLKGDKEEATRQNDMYNELDKQAVDLAESLPLSVEATVQDAEEPKIESLKEEYGKARDIAVDSDAYIRNYLSRRNL